MDSARGREERGGKSRGLYRAGMIVAVAIDVTVEVKADKDRQATARCVDEQISA